MFNSFEIHGFPETSIGFEVLIATIPYTELYGSKNRSKVPKFEDKPVLSRLEVLKFDDTQLVERQTIPAFCQGRPRFKVTRNHSKVTSTKKLRLQQEFFDDAKGLEVAMGMCDDIPGLLFFIKDRQSRFMFVSSAFLLRLGLTEPGDALLTCDHDYSPQVVADRLLRDDHKVMATGVALRNYREPLYRPYEGFTWAVTSKWPIHNHGGKIIGLAGITRKDSESQTQEGLDEMIDSDMARLIRFIVANMDRSLTNDEMARASRLSVRSLTRRVQDTYGLTPRTFASLTRIQMVCQCLVETDKPLVDVALEHGFANQSSFSTQFKKTVGMTPRQFRLKWHPKVEIR